MIEKEPFGGWIIHKMIGKGGHGHIYKSRKGAFCSAVKQIIIPNEDNYRMALEKFNGDESAVLNYYKPEAERMQKEIEIMQTLSGVAGIVIYYDHTVRKYNVRAGWEILIRMEYLTPIGRYISQNGINIRQIIEMGVVLCNALQICFDENILHRDIKENNILLDKRNNFKLVDFGVSKNIENTVAATVTGTFGYMAPEVEKKDVYDHRADIYSLGIVMYKLLNGGLMPFMPENGTITDDERSRLFLLRGESIPKPKYGNQEIVDTVLKACSYRKEDRHGTFDELGSSLKNLLSNTSDEILSNITIKENFSEYQGTSISNYNNLIESIYDGKVYIESANSSSKKIIIGTDDKTIYANDIDDIAIDYINMAELYSEQERYEEAESMYKKALNFYIGMFGEKHYDTALTCMELVGLYFNQDKYKEAESFAKRAVTICEEILGENDYETMGCYYILAETYDAQEEYHMSETLYKKIIKWLELCELTEDDIDYEKMVYKTYEKLAKIYYIQDRYEEAEPLYREALKVNTKLLREKEPDTIDFYYELAFVYYKQERYEEAEFFAKRAVAIYEEVYGENDCDISCYYVFLARMYSMQEKYNQAERLFDKVLNLRINALGSSEPKTLETYDELATAYENQGKYHQAEQLALKSLEIKAKTLGFDDYETAEGYCYVGRINHRSENYRKALNFYNRALEIFDKTYPEEAKEIREVVEEIKGFL